MYTVLATICSEENSSIPNVGVDMLLKDGKLDNLKNGPLYWVDTSDSQPCLGTASAAMWTLKCRGRLFHSGLPHKVHMHLHVLMHTCTCTHTHICAHTHVYMRYVCMHIHRCTHMYINMHVCRYIRTYIRKAIARSSQVVRPKLTLSTS